MAETYDALVIGGGIMGCSTALQLARRGLRVALLEKDAVGAGPTGKSSAILRQHYSNELTARMALYSLGVFQNFAEEIGGACGYTRTGFVALVPSRDQAGLEANLELQKQAGVNTRLLSPSELQQLIPGMVTTDGISAAYEPDSGYADPYLTVTSYAQAARAAGVQIHQDTRVSRLLFKGGRVSGALSISGTRYEAPVIINATGAWASEVAALAEVQVPIDPCRVQVAFFRRPFGEEAVHPVVADFVNATYFRSETGAQTLVGLIDPSEADAIVNPDAFNEGMDDEFVLTAGTALIKRYPAMERSQVTGGYASLYAITPDWHPIVDEVPKGSGFFVCSGFSGHGFKLGPAVGIMTADLVLGVEQPLFSSHLLRFGRFAENDPVRGRYEYSIVG